MKKSLPLLSVFALAASIVAPVFAQEGAINVVSREDGSGTRSAFVEIVGVVDENGDDMTVETAAIQNGTNGVMQTVAQDPAAIGYISLGSLDDSVKAVTVDGVEATAETIKAGEYAIARPFNVAWNKEEEMRTCVKDFMAFIHSEEGQAIVEEEGYIQVTAKDAEDEELKPYEGQEGLSGTIEVVGSTSVSPVMEILAEKYMEINPDITINITSNGSTAGMEAAKEKTADLGMASRELKDEEKEVLEYDAIAMDGIAVIVNNESAVEDLALETIKGIYLGEIVNWEDAVK